MNGKNAFAFMAFALLLVNLAAATPPAGSWWKEGVTVKAGDIVQLTNSIGDSSAKFETNYMTGQNMNSELVLPTQFTKGGRTVYSSFIVRRNPQTTTGYDVGTDPRVWSGVMHSRSTSFPSPETDVSIGLDSMAYDPYYPERSTAVGRFYLFDKVSKMASTDSVMLPNGLKLYLREIGGSADTPSAIVDIGYDGGSSERLTMQPYPRASGEKVVTANGKSTYVQLIEILRINGNWYFAVFGFKDLNANSPTPTPSITPTPSATPTPTPYPTPYATPPAGSWRVENKAIDINSIVTLSNPLNGNSIEFKVVRFTGQNTEENRHRGSLLYVRSIVSGQSTSLSPASAYRIEGKTITGVDGIPGFDGSYGSGVAHSFSYSQPPSQNQYYSMGLDTMNFNPAYPERSTAVARFYLFDKVAKMAANDRIEMPNGFSLTFNGFDLTGDVPAAKVTAGYDGGSQVTMKPYPIATGEKSYTASGKGTYVQLIEIKQVEANWYFAVFGIKTIAPVPTPSASPTPFATPSPIPEPGAVPYVYTQKENYALGEPIAVTAGNKGSRAFSYTSCGGVFFDAADSSPAGNQLRIVNPLLGRPCAQMTLEPQKDVTYIWDQTYFDERSGLSHTLTQGTYIVKFLGAAFKFTVGKPSVTPSEGRKMAVGDSIAIGAKKLRLVSISSVATGANQEPNAFFELFDENGAKIDYWSMSESSRPYDKSGVYVDVIRVIVRGTESYAYVVAKDTGSSPTPPPSNGNNFAIILSKGWNMVSVPVYGSSSYKERESTGTAKLIESTCDASVAWSYNGKAYERESIKSLRAGAGYWIKASDKCSLLYTGDSLLTPTAYSAQLHPGWNLIGAPHISTSLASLKNDCRISSGPWYYGYGEYQKFDALDPGRAYWMKAQNSCTLVLSSDNPPGVPGDGTEPTPTPTIAPGDGKKLAVGDSISVGGMKLRLVSISPVATGASQENYATFELFDSTGTKIDFWSMAENSKPYEKSGVYVDVEQLYGNEFAYITVKATYQGYYKKVAVGDSIVIGNKKLKAVSISPIATGENQETHASFELYDSSGTKIDFFSMTESSAPYSKSGVYVDVEQVYGTDSVYVYVKAG